MEVVVAGAAGKTGTAVVEAARRAGHQVTALVHHAEDHDVPGVVVVQADAGEGR